MEKRLRVFAGPNGSGKSTLVQQMKEKIPLYTVLNADELLVTIKATGKYTHSVPVEKYRLAEFAASTTYPDAVKDIFASDYIHADGCEMYFDVEARTNRVAAVLTEFLKEDFLQRGESFTFETVFSHPSKIDFIHRARELGYRTYLYFVATRSPEINVSPVYEAASRKAVTMPRRQNHQSLPQSPAQCEGSDSFSFPWIFFRQQQGGNDMGAGVQRGGQISDLPCRVSGMAAKFVFGRLT